MILKYSIESTALPNEDASLRAIFSQITAEVRKTGRILSDDEGSFYISRRFGWKSSIKAFFDAYHKICDRKQVPPVYQERRLTAALKVPYADIDTINLFHGGVLRRLMQFREYKVPPFGKLPSNPTTDDLKRIKKSSSGDEDICRFIDVVLLVDEELRQYVSCLDTLAAAYKLRVSAFSMAFRGSGKKSAIRKRYKDSKRSIKKLLSPYIRKLKRIGVIPSSWKYSFKALRLTDEARESLAIMSMGKGVAAYWNEDVLPFQSVRDAAARKIKRETAKRERRPSRGVKLSVPSFWYRFDKWVSHIGDRLSSRMDKITDWLMGAWIWLVVIWAIIAVIGVWMSEGLFAAIIAVVIGFALIGLLEGIAGVIALIVKYVSYIPLYAIRIIFYRGWTFVVAVLAGCGYLLYSLIH